MFVLSFLKWNKENPQGHWPPEKLQALLKQHVTTKGQKTQRPEGTWSRILI